MAYRFTITYNSDSYDVTIINNTITRIIKYLGESQIQRELLYSDLTPTLQNLILAELTHHDND